MQTIKRAIQRVASWFMRRTLAIRAGAAVHDALAAALAMTLALVLRIGHDSTLLMNRVHLTSIAMFVLIASLAGLASGLNRGIWRYASLPDLKAIATASTISIASFAVLMFFLQRLDGVPRSTLVITWALPILLLSGPRVAYRIWRDQRAYTGGDDSEMRGALLIGAGDAADLFVRSAAARSDRKFRVRGIIDERERRVGRSIRGVPILGTIDDLPDILRRMADGKAPASSLILTRNRDAFGTQQFEHILDIASTHRLSLLRLPEVRDIDPATVKPEPIEIQDLLQRPPVALDLAGMADLVAGTTIMVTGAGGSIGSELCRQLLRFKPRRLVLVDMSEYLLYTIDRELRALAGSVEVIAQLGNVRNIPRVERLFERFKPDFVFHAAALKHAPMVEDQPLEGFLTNLFGTRNIADAAIRSGVRAVVLISTDKAVNPANVMGLTKRLAEMYCQTLDREQQTQFVVVRFGNVLGSAGSVVPLFQAQLQAGGPLTVTHPQIERFFMTIPEAAQLLLHAATFAVTRYTGRGRIFVLDMGKPIKIVDLARRMIQLAGLRPEVDIPIAFIGLRPGEKMYEELFSAEEALQQTDAPGVLVATPRQPGAAVTRAVLDQIEAAVEQDDVAATLRAATKLCPQYLTAPLQAPAQAQAQLPFESDNVVRLPSPHGQSQAAARKIIE